MLRFGGGCAGFERGIHVDGETAAGMIVDPCPGVHDVRRMGHGQRASCRICPHSTRLSSTLRARSRKYSLGQVAYQRSSSASIGPIGATKRQLCTLWTCGCPGVDGS